MQDFEKQLDVMKNDSKMQIAIVKTLNPFAKSIKQQIKS